MVRIVARDGQLPEAWDKRSASTGVDERLFLTVLLFIAAAGSGMILYSTQLGPGLGNDSAEYISAARNLLAGNGLSWISGGNEVHPMTHFPPFFSLLLAAGEIVGVDAIEGARLINSVAFGFNILLIGVILKETASPAWFSWLGAIVAASSIFMIRAHTWAMSEPVYLLTSLSGTLFLARYLITHRQRWLAAAAIAIGLAYFTRYIGLALILMAVAGLLLNFRLPWKRRLLDALVFLAISLPPNLWWLARNVHLTGLTANRATGLNLVSADDLAAVAGIIWNWFAPAVFYERYLSGLAGVIVAGFLVTLVSGLAMWLLDDVQVLAGTGERRFVPGLKATLALYGLTFGAVILATTWFTYPPPALNQRIFLPLHVLMIILFMYLLAKVWRSHRLALQLGVAGAAVLLVFSYGYRAWGVAGELRQDGQGFSSTAWRSSETLQATKQLLAIPIYTNQNGAFYLLADRPTYLIPLLNPKRQDGYITDLKQMRKNMANNGAALVLFEENNFSADMLNMAEFTEGLVLVKEFPDGAIFAYPSVWGSEGFQ